MSSAILKAEVRSKLGSRAARQIRSMGRIPATIQGGEGDHLDISIDESEFWSARRHHVHLFDLELGGTTESATVRELQWDPMGDQIDHIEFRRVRRGVAVEVEVALEFVGHPKGGVLNHLASEIEVRCLPTLIPDSIEVKVHELEIGHVLTAGEVVLPEGFELASPPGLHVCNVVAARGLEEDQPAAEEGTEEGAAPEAAPRAGEGSEEG
jgi:large subunit ribosomal protein L25